ncbi:MAG TPA: NADH:flavin oxidoreductase [Acidimicrobiales bacterium]|nr:NADH:flavin oxidoreductase [Acidimicrobiales bacterium]
MIQVRKLRTADAFREHVEALGVALPFADEVDTGLLASAAPPSGNRFAILPMEGWDGTDDGRPTDLVRRRWSRFGTSGAGLIWGGEAVAVDPSGRANPHQLVIGPHVGELRELLGADQYAGLQLTHSGRWSFAEPVTAGPNPVLDRRRPGRTITDTELDDLRGLYVEAAGVAAAAGFDFVDVKVCHGYLLHELTAAGREQFVIDTIAAVRAAHPSIAVGVRLSVFDEVPHRPREEDGRGVPERDAASFAPFGRPDDLAAPIDLVRRLVDAGVSLLCVTAGSPYYCPHVQRPAFFPPSDGYLPPEDPLVGVARLLDATRAVKRAFPELPVVGTGYSYLQEWLPNIASAAVAQGDVDVVGIGRMVLSYHDLPADVMAGNGLDRRRICRTFSDCTTAPRNGLVSGCWPLDPEYKLRPDRPELAAAKRASRWTVSDN